jgi:endonuclease-8
MPEGDTILRAARALGRSLQGKSVTAFSSPLPALADAGLAGRRIDAVEALGKNLIVRFDDGRALVTHMRMTGSWHLYRPGETWKKPARLARAVLATADAVAVCFNAPVVELLSARQVVRSERLRRLGPDVLGNGFDSAAAAERLAAFAERPIGEALLLQSALAGIGNIYKSETLFACGADPFAPVSAFSAGELERITGKARALMSANLSGARRRTFGASGGAPYAVYRRSGSPCRACGTSIRMRRQGTAGRSTYWCPRCQPARSGDTRMSAR